MRVIFVDDSKQAGRRARMGELVALGGVAFKEDQLKPFADAFYAAYDEAGTPRDVEMKWALGNGRRNWFVANDRREALTPLRKSILEAGAACQARVVVAIWDKNRASTANGKGPEEGVIDFMFERFTMMLENADSLGVLVFDKPGGDHRQEDEWIAGTRYLTDLGTDYVRSSAIVIPVLTAPSHHHPHLQLADLITGSVTNAVAGGIYGMELLPQIKPMLHKNWRGNIGGTGLKLYPDSLNNLQHWLLDETEFTRGGGGLALPYQHWPYFEDHGLTG